MQDSQDDRKPPSRRGFFLGTAAGVAAVGAAGLPGMLGAPAPEVEPAPVPAPERGGGYTLSEHVKRYYKTASA